jgi:hypothetical protein
VVEQQPAEADFETCRIFFIFRGKKNWPGNAVTTISVGGITKIRTTSQTTSHFMVFNPLISVWTNSI